MSRISNLRQILSQASRVEKVQQVQQIQGDLENSRLAAQTQKRSEGKIRKVQNAPTADHIEIHDREKNEDRRKREKGEEKNPETPAEEPETPGRIDIRI